MRGALSGLLLALLGAACSPGSTTIVDPADANEGADADAATTPNPDLGTPPGNNGIPDVSTPEDAASPSDVAVTPDARPDLSPPPPGPSTVYVAETDGSIQWGTFDPDTAMLTLEGSIERGGSQNFLAFDAAGDMLYAANGNRVEAFTLADDGTPTFLAEGDAGIGGTHLAVDATRSFVFVASYGGDAVAVLPLDANGAPSNATMTFGGTSDPDFCRRAHQVRVHPSNQFVYVPCLASDYVAVFALDAAAGTVTPQAPASTAAGAGPRHMDFHPALPVAYVIGELDDTITIFDVDEQTGALTNRGVVTTRPNDPTTLGPASDVHASPNGAFVAGINRNPRNELVVFDVARGGGLTHRASVSTEGEHARTFAFTPSGGHVLVGNSNSQDVVVFDFNGGDPVAGQKLTSFDARVFFVGFRPD